MKLKIINGFTLVELLVSMGIMAILSTMGFAAVGNFTEQKQLKMDAMTLETEINTARLLAYEGKDIKKSKGFGIFLSSEDKSNYYVYSDLNGNLMYDQTDEIISKKIFSNKVQFANRDNLDVCFKLSPETGACSSGMDCGASKEKSLTIQGTKTRVSKTIIINLQNGKVRLDETGCPSPYHGYTLDNRCVWSCSEGTTPDLSGIECICKPGLSVVDTDQFGRRICR